MFEAQPANSMSYCRGLIRYTDDLKYFLSAFKTHLAWPVQMKHFIDDSEQGAVYTGHSTLPGHLAGTDVP